MHSRLVGGAEDVFPIGRRDREPSLRVGDRRYYPLCFSDESEIPIGPSDESGMPISSSDQSGIPHSPSDR